MKNVTFYLEYPTKADKRAKRGNPTVLAAIGKPYKNATGAYAIEAVAAMIPENRMHFETIAPLCDWISENCTRISEAKARIAHPEIFNCGLL